ncbi:MAG: ABC transporter permease [Steroidobacteraceae bacterium]
MSNIESTAMPDSPEPLPASQADGSPASGPATLSATRLVYWSVLRELWEHRWCYIVPVIVAAVVVLGFVTGLVRVPLPLSLPHSHFTTQTLPHLLEVPFDFASVVLMATYLVVAVIYCLAALHGERWDRSILFWKSLPVSDLTTVIAKASIPIILLPLIAFAVTVGTHIIMLLAGSAVLLGKGVHVAALWPQIPFLTMWAALLYHLVTVHALYYAPIYGWLLLVSAWARRATFLWASLPIAAVMILEKLVFDTSVFAHMLLSRLAGGPWAVHFPPHGNMPMQAPTLANLSAFLTSPGLWIGLAVFGAFLAGAVWLRRRQGPI